jgi:hypothetical protein
MPVGGGHTPKGSSLCFSEEVKLHADVPFIGSSRLSEQV